MGVIIMAEVGDIYVATWGWEQTNADFFQVIEKTKRDEIGKKITILNAQYESYISAYEKVKADGEKK